MGLISSLHLPEDALERRFSNLDASLLTLSRERVVMLLFLRHFGCIFCREALADLGRVRNDLESRDVCVAIAHMHSEVEAAQFLPRFKLENAPRVSDPTRDLFRAFGLRDGSALQIYSPVVLARAVSAAFRGLPGGPMSPEVRQMPGVFLLRNGRVIAGFVHDRISDRPDYRGLADCIGEDCGGGS